MQMPRPPAPATRRAPSRASRGIAARPSSPHRASLWRSSPPPLAVRNSTAASSCSSTTIPSCRLCRLLREEVAEQLGQGSASLTNLVTDWRKLLFPSATDEAFADGYAQAVTFGLLMARARNITLATTLANGLDWVSEDLDRAMSGLQMSTTVDTRRLQPGAVAAQSDPVCWGGRGWPILWAPMMGCAKGPRSPLCFMRPCWAECGAG